MVSLVFGDTGIVTLVFYIQIYSVDTCSNDGVLAAVPGAIER